MTPPTGAPARILLALAAVAVGFAAYALLAREAPETGAAGGAIDMQVNYAIEPTDERELVGFATHVFVGRVVEKVGSEGAPLSGPGGEIVPRTQFSVAVLKNIKGDLSGEVTVSQTGGYDLAEGRLVRVEGDPLLKPGQQRLFATTYDEGEGWYAIAAQPFGDVPIRGKGQREELVQRFAKAREAQVSFDASGDH